MATAPGKTVPVVLGGLFLGVLSALPFVSAGNACCCLWIVGGGLVAAWLLRHQATGPLTAWDGASVGALAGLVGACVYLLVAVPVQLVLAPLERQAVERLFLQARDVPPEVRAALERWSTGLEGSLVGFVFMLLVGVPVAAVGGVLGTVLSRRGGRPGPSPSPDQG